MPPGRAAAKGRYPRAAARHMVTTKPGRFLIISSFIFFLLSSQPKADLRQWCGECGNRKSAKSRLATMVSRNGVAQ